MRTGFCALWVFLSIVTMAEMELVTEGGDESAKAVSPIIMRPKITIIIIIIMCDVNLDATLATISRCKYTTF